eukprot:gnl/TRDRNA2_/TRDRNA2_80423_c0_seq1.p1 gnl/TRDRNA2_/TRDRNA2_80423_c0~~gnl/TRDRNA2_/TRDRNA2_80423_c0_seq1.p1  ORF type:complete len:392 (-),score=79.82 gnl/TRDRNA2_/TRDRNA2_80423_c0_seq1:65-1240(-)
MAGPGVKIKDGLFIGDEEASTDLECAMEAKVTRMINCCGGQVPNRFEMCGIVYLTYKWLDITQQCILDDKDVVINQVYDFIEAAHAKGEGVLVHSLLGESRSCCILSAYVMKKYRWTLRKTTEYFKSRKVNVRMKPGFLQQLLAFESRLSADESQAPLSNGWDADAEAGLLESESFLLRNTFLNANAPAGRSQIAQKDGRPTAYMDPDYDAEHDEPDRPHKIRWHQVLIDGAEEPEVELNSDGVAVKREAGKPCRSALKGALQVPLSEPEVANSSVEKKSRSKDGKISIKTRSGVVQCSADDIVLNRLGLMIECGTIILEYMVPSLGLRAHHTVNVKLDKGTKRSRENGDFHPTAHDKATAEHLQHVHGPWLSGVSTDQLARLVCRLQCSI